MTEKTEKTEKTVNEFVDTGFGFPVKLLKVPMIKRRGAWSPKINYRELANAVLLALCVKPAQWTGSEVRFVRQELKMTLTEFAKKFYVTHPAVLKWERRGDEPTKMGWSTEKDIRLFVYLQFTDEDRLSDVYRQLERKGSERCRRTKIDVTEAALALA